MKTYQNHAMTDAEARQALADACKQVETNLPLYTWQCQNHSSVNGIYPGCANNQWTCGFWPGEVWLSYERTGDEAFKNTALTLVDSSAGCEDKTKITAIIASVTASAGYFAYFFMAAPPLRYFCLL